MTRLQWINHYEALAANSATFCRVDKALTLQQKANALRRMTDKEFITKFIGTSEHPTH